jgi:ubiquitin C-terminal hydrolase
MLNIVPRSLIVHLKRFTPLGTKLKTPLNFPEVFSFDSDYLLEDVALKERNHAYRLYAIIVHQGYSAHKGHYYCYIRPSMCKGGLTGECEGDESKCWYKYDDESVKLIDDIEAQMLST